MKQVGHKNLNWPIGLEGFRKAANEPRFTLVVLECDRWRLHAFGGQPQEG